MDTPETAWLEEPEIFDGMGFWQETQSADLVEYVRADLHRTALDAEKARADAAEAALKTAREALIFYADKDSDGYDAMATDYGLSVDVGEIIKDGGALARAVLAALDGETK